MPWKSSCWHGLRRTLPSALGGLCAFGGNGVAQGWRDLLTEDADVPRVVGRHDDTTRVTDADCHPRGASASSGRDPTRRRAR
jgi:hypothetical protein